MAKAKKKQKPILSLDDVKAAKQLDELIGRCYEGVDTIERLPPFWKIIDAARRIDRDDRNLPKLCWDLEHQYFALKGQPKDSTNGPRPLYKGGYLIPRQALDDIQREIRYSFEGHLTRVRSLVFRHLGIDLDCYEIPKPVATPTSDDQGETNQGSLIEIEDTVGSGVAVQPEQRPQTATKRRTIEVVLRRSKRLRKLAEVSEAFVEIKEEEAGPSSAQPANDDQNQHHTQNAHDDDGDVEMAPQVIIKHEPDHNAEQITRIRREYEDQIDAMEAEISQLRRNEGYLIQCGLTWRKERDELRQRLAGLP